MTPLAWSRWGSVLQVPGPFWLDPSVVMQPAVPGSWVSAPVLVFRRKIISAPGVSEKPLPVKYAQRPFDVIATSIPSPPSSKRPRATAHVPGPALLDPSVVRQPALPESW